MIGDLSINMVGKFVECLELFGFETLSITIDYTNKNTMTNYKKRFDSYKSLSSYIDSVLDDTQGIANNFTSSDAIYCIDSIKVRKSISDRVITIDTIGIMDDRKSYVTQPRTEAQGISTIYTDRTTTFLNDAIDEYVECYEALNKLYINDIVKYDYMCFVPLVGVRDNAHILRDYTEFGKFSDYSRICVDYFKHPTLDIVEPDIVICDGISHN